MTVRVIKTTEVISAFVMFCFGLFACLGLIAASLTPGGTINPNLLVWVFIVSFVIGIFEAARFLLVRNLAMDEEKLSALRRKGLFAQFGRALGMLTRYSNMIVYGFFSLVLLAVTGFFLYVIIKNIVQGNAAFTPQFYLQIILYPAYFLVLRRFFAFLGRRLSGQGASLVEKWDIIPTYTVEPDGVVIDLKVKQFLVSTSQRRKFVFKIGFNELQTIRMMTYFEAVAFMKYQVGPDLELAAKKIRDFVLIRQQRPNKYFQMGGSGRKYLLLQGPQIFYLIPLTKHDINDLLAAYQKYKQYYRRR